MLNRIVSFLSSVAFLSACANPDSVLFVTKTSLSVLEADSKPAGISIAYDRVEGYIGPRYDNGSVPPVYASVESNGEIFNPKINQLYATGDAARVVAGGSKVNNNDQLSGGKKLMFFGTSTTTGLKIATTNNIPDSFVFGFRRKEFSYIPLGKDGNVDKYPAVIASIRTEANSSVSADGKLVESDVKLSNSQFFATGGAAVSLAPTLRDDFKARAKAAIGQGLVQKAEVARSLRCYVGLEPKDKRAMWDDALRRNLFTGDATNDNYQAMTTLYGEAIAADGSVTDLAKLSKADQFYAASIFIDDEADPDRARRLEEHRAAVCATVAKTLRDDA